MIVAVTVVILKQYYTDRPTDMGCEKITIFIDILYRRLGIHIARATANDSRFRSRTI